MTVRSTPGQGTTFRIRLFLPQLRQADAVQAAPRGHRTGYVGVRRRVWVVDNEEADRGLMVRLLTPLGFEVETFASGIDCLAQLRHGQATQRPDAIFMDLAMPGLDGWSTLRALGQEGLSQAPAAIVSANAFDKSLDNDVGITTEDFIVKPVRVNELLDWLGGKLQLQWIETERPLSAATEVLPSQAQAEVLPSSAALRLLEDQIHAGYIRGIHKVLDQMALAEPAAEVFVQRMRAMAKQFQLDAMAQTLKQALSQPEK
jgi:CheY-like chemotaxis protein